MFKKKAVVKIRAVIVLTVLGLLTGMISVDASESKLNARQQENADRIAAIVSEHWDEYGCLPSVCIAQAMQESGLGEHCRGNNLWGIQSGAESYSSIEAGAIRYMKVINNGYYKGAPFETDWRVQIRRILDGGYCQPEGAYESYVHSIVNKYNLTKYDDEMFAAIEKKREEERKKKEEEEKKSRKKMQKKTFTFEYVADACESNEMLVCEKVIPSGLVSVDFNGEWLGYFDVKTYKKMKGVSKYIIYTNRPELDGYKTKIEVIEDAVG